MSTKVAVEPVAPIPPDKPRLTYLNVAHTISSWLLTTDHKRIAILYLIPVTLMFFIGGVAIGIDRLNLVTPSGGLVSADTYNKFFTVHGVVMVFFFLVPVIPTVLGNFFLPMSDSQRPMKPPGCFVRPV